MASWARPRPGPGPARPPAADTRDPTPTLAAADDPALSAPSDLGTPGKYRILRLLGKGEMGAVILGYDPMLQR
ncbi:MAG: hypothetical protein K2P78_10995 [Gemmataceae bacterium]|nr:hypothetical protein [Gemmataceae bacterium]